MLKRHGLFNVRNYVTRVWNSKPNLIFVGCSSSRSPVASFMLFIRHYTLLPPPSRLFSGHVQMDYSFCQIDLVFLCVLAKPNPSPKCYEKYIFTKAVSLLDKTLFTGKGLKKISKRSDARTVTVKTQFLNLKLTAEIAPHIELELRSPTTTELPKYVYRARCSCVQAYVTKPTTGMLQTRRRDGMIQSGRRPNGKLIFRKSTILKPTESLNKQTTGCFRGENGS